MTLGILYAIATFLFLFSGHAGSGEVGLGIGGGVPLSRKHLFSEVVRAGAARFPLPERQ
jgi:hypothetical protein